MRASGTWNDVKVAAGERPWSLVRSVSEPLDLRPRPSALVAVAIAVDALLLIGSFTFAYAIGFVLPDGRASPFVPDSGLGERVVVALVAIGLLASHNLYDLEHPQPWSTRLYTILSSTSIALVVAIGVSVVFGAALYTRPWLAAGWVIAVAALAIWHAGIERGCAALPHAIAPTRRAIVVGANAAGQESARELESKGYRVVGYADNASDLLNVDRPLLGPIARLDEFVETFSVDELVIALPADRRAQVSSVLTRGFARHVQVNYAPDLGDLLPRRFNIREIGARQYIEFAPVARVSWAKRVLDMTLAVLGLAALLPVFVLVALAIKLDSSGPVLYGQARVGKDGRHFRMLKFRSMRQDADELLPGLLERNEVSGPMFKIRSDPRITRVGRFLRRYSVDELPQLINVMLGEMSLVGPRPPMPAEVERYEDWQIGRLRALPGITGLWQVSGRSDVPFHDMVRLDLQYIRNWSLALDLEILLRTIPAVLTVKGAY